MPPNPFEDDVVVKGAWALLADRYRGYTDLVYLACKSLLQRHTTPDLRMECLYEASSMLAQASERRFALSQVNHLTYNFQNDHVKKIGSALALLFDFFYDKDLYMASPFMPGSPWADDNCLQGISPLYLETNNIPEFILGDPVMSVSSSISTSPRRSYKRVSNLDHPASIALNLTEIR